MVLKPPRGGFPAKGSDGLVMPSQSPPSLSHAVEKISTESSGCPDSGLAKQFADDGEGSQRTEFQGATAGNASSPQCSLRDRRLALEQDVDNLRKKLKHEENVHRALERAFTRSIGALPRLPPFLPPKTQELLAEVAVLEEEVIHLEEQIIHLRQGLYQEAVHVSASKKKEPVEDPMTFKGKKPDLHRSPSLGHLHAQESQQGKQNLVRGGLLASKKECSLDGILRTTDRTLRTPDRNFRMGGLHKKQTSLGSVSETNGLLFLTQVINGKHPLYKELEESETLKPSKGQGLQRLPKASHEKENQLHMTNKNMHTLPQVSKVNTGAQKQSSLYHRAAKMPPPTPKVKKEHSVVTSSFGPRNLLSLGVLEDGKITQPNKLSEEIVRCLLSIFLKLTKPSFGTDYETSSVVSQSTLSSVSSRSYASRSGLICKTPTNYSEETHFQDPYGVCVASVLRDVGPYKYLHDITARSFDLSRIPSCASLLRRLRVLLNKLCSVDLRGLKYQQKLAFWINIYNSCMMHAFLEYGIPGTPQRVVALLRKAVLNVGGHLLNALAIEHFILRLPHHSKDAYWKRGKTDEEVMMRNVYRLEWSEPLVTFALCCGSRSSPAVRVYTAAEVEMELEAAKKDYLQAAIGVTTKKKVLIPKLLDWYMRDFAKDIKSLLEWICEQLPSSLRNAVEECLRGERKDITLQVIEVMPYEFDFRYLLAS